MSGCVTINNVLRIKPILSAKTESLTTKTFTFRDKLFTGAKPGQFLMLWVPRIGEIPLSIMNVKSSEVSVTVKMVGKTTRFLHRMGEGENVGLRGPFGNSFSQSKGKLLIVGGGTGIAPLMFLANKLVSNNNEIFFVIGAKTSSELLFMKKIRELHNVKHVIVTTEDGSLGIKCLVTKPLKTLLKKETFDMVYSCGPELMVRKVFDIVDKHKMRFEASLERLMRCSIGLCGSCMIGKYRVCKDGPIFSGKQLRDVSKEFGVSKLSSEGKQITL